MAEVSTELRSSTANSKATCLLVSALFLLTGGVVAAWSGSTCGKGRDSLRWQQVQGDLLTIAWHSPSDGSDYPTVQYRYDFEGKSREGNKILFGAASEASCKLVQVRAGEKITIFVNPQDPAESVLLPGASGFAKACLGIGIGLVILGLAVGTSLLYHAPKR